MGVGLLVTGLDGVGISIGDGGPGPEEAGEGGNPIKVIPTELTWMMEDGISASGAEGGLDPDYSKSDWESGRERNLQWICRCPWLLSRKRRQEKSLVAPFEFCWRPMRIRVPSPESIRTRPDG